MSNYNLRNITKISSDNNYQISSFDFNSQIVKKSKNFKKDEINSSNEY